MLVRVLTKNGQPIYVNSAFVLHVVPSEVLPHDECDIVYSIPNMYPRRVLAGAEELANKFNWALACAGGAS